MKSIKDFGAIGNGIADDFSAIQSALRLEANMDNFNISGFNYIADEETAKRRPALKAKNLVKCELTIDGKTHTFDKKEDELAVNSFTDLTMNRK